MTTLLHRLSNIAQSVVRHELHLEEIPDPSRWRCVSERCRATAGGNDHAAADAATHACRQAGTEETS
jgi:hypothetical protein